MFKVTDIIKNLNKINPKMIHFGIGHCKVRSFENDLVSILLAAIGQVTGYPVYYWKSSLKDNAVPQKKCFELIK